MDLDGTFQFQRNNLPSQHHARQMRVGEVVRWCARKFVIVIWNSHSEPFDRKASSLTFTPRPNQVKLLENIGYYNKS